MILTGRSGYPGLCASAGAARRSPARQAEKLFGLLADRFQQLCVIDRKTWAITRLKFSECVLGMIGRGVSNQTERIGVDPALVLAASEPSARDLASPRTVSAAYDPEIRTLANRRSQTECLTCIFAGLRRRSCVPLSENTNQREKACDLGHFCPPCVGSANRSWGLQPKKADALVIVSDSLIAGQSKIERPQISADGL